jgi:integrase
MERTPRGFSYTTRQIKTHVDVTVFLEPWLAQKLRALRALTPEGHVFWDRSRSRDIYVNSQIRKPLRGLGEKLGFKEVLRPHRFRDSFAVNQINRGVLLSDVATLLGHKSVRTTEQHYLPYVKSRKLALEKRLYEAGKLVEAGKLIEMPMRS